MVYHFEIVDVVLPISINELNPDLVSKDLRTQFR